MSQTRPFSKLKKNIESLFDEKLKMQFCCIVYPMRSQRGSTSMPRYYVKLGKEIIWDFPKDFKYKEMDIYQWSENNDLCNLVRDYIDTPLEKLLNKKFKQDTFKITVQYLQERTQENVVLEFRLAELFKASDRRLGKEKLLKWATKINNPNVDRILEIRFDSNNWMKKNKDYIVIAELPKKQQEPFMKWMDGQTVPLIKGEGICAYKHDYNKWYEYWLGKREAPLMD